MTTRTWRRIALGASSLAAIALPVPALLALLGVALYSISFPVSMAVEIARGGTVETSAVLPLLYSLVGTASLILPAIPLVAWVIRIVTAYRSRRTRRDAEGDLAPRPLAAPKASPPRRMLAALIDMIVALAPAGWPAFLIASWVTTVAAGNTSWWPSDAGTTGHPWGLLAWQALSWAGFGVSWLAWVRDTWSAHRFAHGRRTLGHRIAGIRFETVEPTRHAALGTRAIAAVLTLALFAVPPLIAFVGLHGLASSDGGPPSDAQRSLRGVARTLPDGADDALSCVVSGQISDLAELGAPSAHDDVVLFERESAGLDVYGYGWCEESTGAWDGVGTTDVTLWEYTREGSGLARRRVRLRFAAEAENRPDDYVLVRLYRYGVTEQVDGSPAGIWERD